MTNRREFARQQADAFVVRTLDSIGKVLADHSRGVADFACEMQDRLDVAETLLAEIAACRRGQRRNREKVVRLVGMHVDLLERVDALVAQSKVRTS